MRPAMQPPRRAVRLLETVLPDDAREHVLGDLAEIFAHRCASAGERPARRWYWRQALAFAVRFAWERARDRRPAWGAAATSGGAAPSSLPSWIDVKLGFRMLAKYPGLTIIGGFAIMVSIGVGAAWFEFANDYISPTLPLDEGDRIVGIRNWDTQATELERRTLYDLELWRREVRTVRQLSAYRTLERNLITEEGRSEPVRLAEVTASAFRVARVQPLLGRTLLDDDEHPSAPPVAVIGYGVWQSRFDGDREVIGRTVRIGEVMAQIVGVMPEGFAFPVNHAVWTPLRVEAAAVEPRAGMAVTVFGRLAPGASLEDARAELGRLGERMALDHPDTHRYLRTQVKPYVESLSDDIGREVLYFNVVFVLILIVACTNVATLVFARAATRERELAVRNALGASRGRIIGQLFIEALVLAGVAATVALVLTAIGLKIGMRVFWEVQGGAHRAPFWWNDDLAPGTILYVGVLTVLGAAVVGILPAIKVTGRDVASRLRAATAGGAAIRFGGIWTAIIVVQVALTVVFLSAAGTESAQAMKAVVAEAEIQNGQYLSVQLVMDDDVPPAADAERYGAEFRARLRRAQENLRRLLSGEPGIEVVTFGNRLPGMPHYVEYLDIEGEPEAAAPEGGHQVRGATVDVGFFDAFDAPMLAGRAFQRADVDADRRVAIVNQSFVADVLGGRNPVGLRVRRNRPGRGEEAPWYEIIGVTKDLGVNPANPEKSAALYFPMTPGAMNGVFMAVRVPSDPMSFAPRLREIAADVDPALRLAEMKPLADHARAERNAQLAFVALMAALLGAAFLLSTAGVYSLMSLTVSQRTREIGIRAALGAEPRQILTSIFSRAFAQLGLGILIGAAIVMLSLRSLGPGESVAEQVRTTLVVSLVMLMVGLCACVVPARRGLRVQPTEALREG